MEFEFPIDRIGERNQEGRTKARFLEVQEAEYLKAETEEGVWAYKKGDFLEVEAEDETVVDTFFISIGHEGGAIRSHRSANARGNFSEAGPPLPDGSWTGILQLEVEGNGYGATWGPYTPSGNAEDFSGNLAPITAITWYRTRTGRTFEGVQDFVTIGCDILTGGSGLFPGNVIWMTIARADGQWWRSFVVDQFAFGTNQHVVLFFQYSPNEVFQTTAYAVENQIVKLRGCDRLGPKTFMLTTVGARAFFYSGFPVYDSTGAPLLEFHISVNNGTTWETLPEPLFLTVDFDDFRTLRADPFGHAAFNQLYIDTRVVFYPLDGDRVVMSMWMPYWVDVGAGTLGYTVITALFHIASRTWELKERKDYPSHTAGDADYYHHANSWWERGMLPVPGGVLIFRAQQDGAVGPDYWNYGLNPFTIGFSEDGSEPAETWESPFPAYKMGIPTMLDATRIVCPCFDGQYSLYESADLMHTWTRRATISPDTTEPVWNGWLTPSAMRDFAVLSWLRQNGRAKNPTPQIPWHSDERVAPP